MSALETAVGQLHTVTETMSAAATRCSRDLRYLWVSKPYAEWMGQPLERIVGRPIREVIGEEAYGRLLPRFLRVLAHDGHEAVEKTAAYKPDVLLLDLGMPRMNGYDACRIIRAQPWGEKIVIVAVTGWGQTADRRRSHEAGFNAHLVKPIDYAELIRLLGEEASSAGQPV